ncbi:S1 family peptidase [Paractinoplanes rishiriensis]|uniref:Serine protease n=1 Tax=Paractinoplanes rishiriensis TaxID=1050105 RepID=A0A919JQ92_9ACTN|nr:S1 family peptidase [Actinoplanes rishiriensis]GIE93136.1 serine protease [Actinoplanes rishiriensis]
MFTTRLLAITAVAAAAVTVVTLSALPSGAEPVPEVPDGMIAAMKRDLNLDDDQIATRLRTEATAAATGQRLRARLGSAFAGAWIPTGAAKLTVAVTTDSAAEAVRAEGATPAVVPRSGADLAASRAKLDRNASRAAGADVHGWYVDVPGNRVVVLAEPGAVADAEAFAAAADAGPVTVLPSAGRPRPLADIRGGDQYATSGNLLCSVGFAVTGGFVTAGHCGDPGITTVGADNLSQGTFQGSSFPADDYGWVSTNPGWVSQPWVNDYAGGNVLVRGSTEAAIGSAVCRSGRTTGWHCGTLLGVDETIVYSDGAVSGLSRSDACAEPGDSGGSWLAGDQAQGVTSGGTGNCTDGGIMWFQPVNEILEVYGLTLTVSP